MSLTHRIRDFLVREWHALAGIHDTPHSIAGGAAIGIFLGFTPLFGFKTLIAMLVAWVFRCSYVAAAIAVSLHDVVFFLIPVILRLEYGIGFFLLHYPHLWPPKINVHHLQMSEWFKWNIFIKIGWPMLVGSLFVGIPLAAATYFITLPIVTRYQARRKVAKAKVDSLE